MSSINKKTWLKALCAPLLFASTASQAITIDASGTLNLPNLLADIDFKGSMSMYNPSGEIITFKPSAASEDDPTKHPVEGRMTLDLFSFGGTVDMSGPKPLFESEWSLTGEMAAHVDVLGRLGLVRNPKCGGSLLCADADIMLTIFGSARPITASFGMTPMFEVGLGWGPLNLRTNMSFEVSSLDADKDGVPGTAVDSFFNNTPAFEGIATITRIYFAEGIENPSLVEVPPVPVPAAVWLFASGLIGLGGIAHHQRKKAIAA